MPKTKSPVAGFTSPPPRPSAYRPWATSAMTAAGPDSPGRTSEFGIRGCGTEAYDCRRPFPLEAVSPSLYAEIRSLLSPASTPWSNSTVPWAEAPSSSTSKEPQPLGNVASSTPVNSSLPTCSPRRPAYTVVSLAIASASSPWPQASWKSTPPPPALRTTVISPAGEMTVVLNAGGGGVLFHEACGHGLEADAIAKDTTVYACLLYT